jgi:hypothetical protein
LFGLAASVAELAVFFTQKGEKHCGSLPGCFFEGPQSLPFQSLAGWRRIAAVIAVIVI